MKQALNIFKIYLIFAITPLCIPVLAQENLVQSDKAAQIIDEMINREDGKTIYSEVMLVTCAYKNVGGKCTCNSHPIKKHIETLSIDVGDNLENTISLGIINDPPSEKNMAFLQKDYDEEGRESDQWMYFPALKKLKRIVSQSDNSPKTGSVFGSEISYEDIEKKHLSDYRYSFEGVEQIDNHTCDKITAYPAEKHSPKTSYSKEIYWIDQTTKIPLKRELYDKRDQLVKTFFSKELTEIKGIWINKISIAVNHQSRNMTMEKRVKIAVNIPIEEDLVDLRALKDAAYRESKMKIIREQTK